MPYWAQLIWCGLFLLLSFPPRIIGPRGAAVLTMILGIPLRIWAILLSIGTLWMLVGIAWAIVGAFYILTVLWVVYLWMLFRGRESPSLARWMARLAVIESAASLNAAAGVLVALLTSGVVGSPYRPGIALLFAVAQFVYLYNAAKATA